MPMIIVRLVFEGSESQNVFWDSVLLQNDSCERRYQFRDGKLYVKKTERNPVAETSAIRHVELESVLSIPEDYDVLGFTLSSEPNVISIRIRLPDFDMGEMRAIQYKQEETGFITVEELMRLQKAGFTRPREVPPKPQPKSQSVRR